jgi:hypothetical protein
MPSLQISLWISKFIDMTFINLQAEETSDIPIKGGMINSKPI